MSIMNSSYLVLADTAQLISSAVCENAHIIRTPRVELQPLTVAYSYEYECVKYERATFSSFYGGILRCASC